MNSLIYPQVKHSSMAAIALAVLVVWFAGMAIPAQAQEHPPAFFPYPSTFQINGIVNYGDLLGVQAAVAGDFNGDGKLDIVSIIGGGWEIDVALGNGDGTFQYPIVNTFSFSSGHGPYAIAVGDFNGDGKLDLAVWGIYSPGPNSEVNIFLGNGDGTFTYSGTYTAPNSSDGNPGSNSLYVADFNSDGKLDLAALAPYNSQNISCVYIYLGNGDGTFQTAVAYSTIDPNHPNNINVYGMAVGDLNGDGKPDIAVTQSSGMAVLLNNGYGTFGTATYYDANLCCGDSSEVGIAIGDVNGDKKNDIVITTNRYGYLVLYLNQGNGTFALKGSVGQASGGGGSWLVNMADINHDKKMDLVVTDMVGEIWTFYGKGDGTFTAGPVYPVQYWEQGPDNVVLADFNGDGVLDIFKPLEDHTWFGQVTFGRSDGTFQTNAAYGWNANGYGYNLVTADFNGDGFPDVAYSGSDNQNQPGFEVMLGSSHGVLGNPTFVPVATSCGGYTEWIATGDVNGDGKADIVATINNNCQYNQVAVLTGRGNGKFNNPVYYSTGSTAQPYDVFLEDVNGDGKPDIIVSNQDGTISLLLNNGKGKFKTAKLITSVAGYSPHLHALTFGDFNGDGKLDIAAATYYPQDQSPTGSNVYILLGNGDGTFQAPIVVVAAPQYTYTETLAAGDFNNDGKTDLLVTLEPYGCTPLYGSAAYTFLKGNGDGTFTAGPINCTSGDFPMYPVVADFNADGKLDAFIPMLEDDGKTPIGPAVLEGNGDGTFTRLGEYYLKQLNAWMGGFYVGSTSRGAVVADFNGDGTPDIAVLNADNYAIGDYVTFVTVMFNATQPVSVSPLNLNFGTVTVNSKKMKTVILTNNQTTSLKITSITLGGADPGDFSQTSNCGKALKAGFECTIKVTFTPTTTGQRTATLNIKDSVGTQTVQLSGTGQ